MGKPTGKKNQTANKNTDIKVKHQHKTGDSKSKSVDEDVAIFITLSQELKEEGNKLFRKKDHESAFLKYEKALKLLPQNHIDCAILHTNMASCFMQMGPGEYHRAVNECNLALEVSPSYSKALLKRSRCYEALDRLDLAWKDVNLVLSIESNNLAALDIAERLKKSFEENGIKIDDKGIVLDPENAQKLMPSVPMNQIPRKKKKKKEDGKKVVEEIFKENGEAENIKDISEDYSPTNVKEENVKQKAKKKKNKKLDGKSAVKETLEDIRNEPVMIKDVQKDNVHKDPLKENYEEQTVNNDIKKELMKSVKLVFGEDIRWAQMPVDCTFSQLREIVRSRFPKYDGVLIKYKDREGDLMTITDTKELRWAEDCFDSQSSIRLYIVEVHPEHEPKISGKDEKYEDKDVNIENSLGDEDGKSYCVDEWILQFASLFKNHAGFDSVGYLDLHAHGMKFYSEALEEVLTSEEAQDIFEIAANKFQEMTSLALFNWGNVYVSRARKEIVLNKDSSMEIITKQTKTAYEWAQHEYVKAGKRFEEALKIKPDFYEALFAMGQQQFELAMLHWLFAVANNVDIEGFLSSEILKLFYDAENNMEKGMKMWMEEEKIIYMKSKVDPQSVHQPESRLDEHMKDISIDENVVQTNSLSSNINLLCGTIFYEHSIVEFKLGLSTWEPLLNFAVEKFKLSGVSPTDITVIVKNHCSSSTVPKGLELKIHEIVEAWHDMYDAKKWVKSIPYFHLEPLLRRRLPKLHHVLENV